MNSTNMTPVAENDYSLEELQKKLVWELLVKRPLNGKSGSLIYQILNNVNMKLRTNFGQQLPILVSFKYRIMAFHLNRFKLHLK